MPEPTTSAAPKETVSMTVLKWAYRHYSLEVDEFDSVDDAVDAARWASDKGDESLLGVEVWDEAGHRYMPAGEVMDLAEARRPPESPSVKFVAVVEALAPEGAERGRMEWFTTLADAEAFIAHWRPILGERLSLRKLK